MIAPDRNTELDREKESLIIHSDGTVDSSHTHFVVRIKYLKNLFSLTHTHAFREMATKYNNNNNKYL